LDRLAGDKPKLLIGTPFKFDAVKPNLVPKIPKAQKYSPSFCAWRGCRSAETGDGNFRDDAAPRPSFRFAGRHDLVLFALEVNDRLRYLG
jgi:hypothetical protein